MKKGRPLQTALLGWLITSATLSATDVQWNSTLFAVNQNSAGQLLDRNWSFYLGYFEEGFSPTNQNTKEWASQWTSVDAARYFELGSRFANQWVNDGSATGKQAWVWGVKRQDLANEWILLRGSSWFFPQPGGIGFPVSWSAGGATEVIVGVVNSGGIHLRTEVVAGEPPRLSYSLWQRENFSASEIQGGTLATVHSDPDGDGVSNVVEFALASDPRSAASRPILTAEITGDGRLEFASSRLRQGAVLLVPGVSGDLVTWQTGPAFVSELSSTPLQVTFQDQVGGSKRFGRVRVALP